MIKIKLAGSFQIGIFLKIYASTSVLVINLETTFISSLAISNAFVGSEKKTS